MSRKDKRGLVGATPPWVLMATGDFYGEAAGSWASDTSRLKSTGGQRSPE